MLIGYWIQVRVQFFHSLCIFENVKPEWQEGRHWLLDYGTFHYHLWPSGAYIFPTNSSGLICLHNQHLHSPTFVKEIKGLVGLCPIIIPCISARLIYNNLSSSHIDSLPWAFMFPSKQERLRVETRQDTKYLNVSTMQPQNPLKSAEISWGR